MKRPNDSVVERVLLRIHGDGAATKYFFSKLNDPCWITPLREKGYFKSPPPPIPADENSVYLPQWPEIKYLIRMAVKAPELTHEVLLGIDETENVRVQEDILRAAIALPDSLAKDFVPLARAALKARYVSQAGMLCGELMEKLAESGEKRAAIAIAHAVLEVHPAKERFGEAQSTALDEWQYGQVLQKNVPTLVRAYPEEAIYVLCRKLATALQEDSDDGEKRDYSSIWFHSIESPREKVLHTREHLVVALRDCGQLLLEENPEHIHWISKQLEEREYPVFLRILLHLLEKSDVSKDDVRRALCRKDWFDDSELYHEYMLLLRSRFALLPEEDQKTILEWIENEPDVERFREWREADTKKSPSDEEVEVYRQRTIVRRLAVLRDVLPENWKNKFAESEKKFGVPDNPEYRVGPTKTWVGPTSPLSQEDMLGMGLEEISNYLTEWEPENERMKPTPEGLGRILAEVVASRGVEFSKAAMSFKGIDPTYVRSVLSGLRNAVRNNKSIEWLPVLDLCEWVVKQDRDSARRVDTEYLDLDPGWGWTRKEIASLLASGMERPESGLGFDQRERVWKILEVLAEDPDPTPEDEARQLKSGSVPGHLSINTTRGEALHTVVRYALWVRRGLGIPDSDPSLEQSKEVRTLLEKHLDWSNDPSLTIRSVYGQWFPWLVLLDSRWAEELANTIFPEDDEGAERWWAAWNMYVSFCAPYTSVFEVIRDKYGFAVDRIGKWRGNAESLEHPEKRFAEHIILIFGRGLVNLDKGSLVWRLFSRGSSELRNYAMDFVGRSAESVAEHEEVLDRFRKLWEWRKDELKGSGEEDRFAELTSFGGWFASGVFDDKWGIGELLEQLRQRVPVDRSFAVIERLRQIVEVYPGDVLECVDLLLDRDSVDWGISASREEIKAILNHTLKSDDLVVAERAKRLWNRLGRLSGYEDFRDLGETPET